MRVIANSNFVHGAFTVSRGEEVAMPEAIARELEGAGLVRAVGEKAAPTPGNKMAEAPDNKAASKAGKAK